VTEGDGEPHTRFVKRGKVLHQKRGKMSTGQKEGGGGDSSPKGEGGGGDRRFRGKGGAEGKDRGVLERRGRKKIWCLGVDKGGGGCRRPIEKKKVG